MFPADALADPVRRAIVERLADGEVGAGEIAAAFPISRPAISRHLRVLREAGLVRSRVAGQQRIYALDRRPLAELDAWLERFRPLPVTPSAPPGPAGRLDALDTEMHRGRRARRARDHGDHGDQGDRDDRSAG
ncbi:ArsR/SmtB family transcription factor [Actinomycetospora cinnamomea]|uniref:ArsR family transcriptional regulator n=1 Tax=Actinomycetospora cinnamomea TaxID=663609 RepID=A0A2U1FFK0_9PSEU|nr:metalloregulator ArsR/SmtB family transcription factor [Actinomycetospora cinnamomea]PVZ10991.1 ArsR family transcriptional regulator [Actinomycetospora cinnamomea]